MAKKVVPILGTTFFGHFCYKTGPKTRFLSKRWAQKSSKAENILWGIDLEGNAMPLFAPMRIQDKIPCEFSILRKK